VTIERTFDLLAGAASLVGADRCGSPAKSRQGWQL